MALGLQDSDEAKQWPRPLARVAAPEQLCAYVAELAVQPLCVSDINVLLRGCGAAGKSTLLCALQAGRGLLPLGGLARARRSMLACVQERVRACAGRHAQTTRRGAWRRCGSGVARRGARPWPRRSPTTASWQPTCSER